MVNRKIKRKFTFKVKFLLFYLIKNNAVKVTLKNFYFNSYYIVELLKVIRTVTF